MKLKYLGTAAAEGWPAVFCDCKACKKAMAAGGKNIRTRAQAVVDEKLLIDFGPDTYLHVLQHRIPLYNIQHCIITHAHNDHFYPSELFLKAKPYAVNGKTHPMTVYGNAKVRNLMERMKTEEDDSDNFAECLSYKKAEAGKTLEICGYQVTPLWAAHDPSEDCFIYYIQDAEGKGLLYGNDTAYFPDQTWEFLQGKNIDILSLDATMGILADCPTHMGMQTAFLVKQRLMEMGCLKENTRSILHHFSHNQGAGLLHEEMEEIAGREGCEIAYDGLEVRV